MRINWLKLVAPFLGILLIGTACSSQNDVTGEKVAHGEGAHDVQNINNPKIIPSIDSAKKQTTDEHGGTTQGIGSNVYSLIGSSGLHDGGISSHLESRLSGEGINGIEVFVLDDTVILARAKSGVTSNQYDPMQQNVLNGTNDISGKNKTGSNKEYTDDNLAKASEYMKKVFNGHIKILTVTKPEAVDLIERIKSNLLEENTSYDKVSADIGTLLKMTK